MAKRGRPATRPSALREGYYLEIRTKGTDNPIKIRRDSKAEIQSAIDNYRRSKIVTYLGQVKEGRWVDGKNKGLKTA